MALVTLAQSCVILVWLLLSRGWALEEADKRVIVQEHADEEDDIADHGEAAAGAGYEDDGGYSQSYDDKGYDEDDHGSQIQYGGSNEHHGYGGYGDDYGGSHGGSYGDGYGGSHGGSYGDSYGGSHGGGSYGGKATSYQRVTIHSGHPVKVYVKGHGTLGEHEEGSYGSRGDYGGISGGYGSRYVPHKNYGGYIVHGVGTTGLGYDGGY